MILSTCLTQRNWIKPLQNSTSIHPSNTCQLSLCYGNHDLCSSVALLFINYNQLLLSSNVLVYDHILHKNYLRFTSTRKLEEKLINCKKCGTKIGFKDPTLSILNFTIWQQSNTKTYPHIIVAEQLKQFFYQFLPLWHLQQ